MLRSHSHLRPCLQYGVRFINRRPRRFLSEPRRSLLSLIYADTSRHFDRGGRQGSAKERGEQQRYVRHSVRVEGRGSREGHSVSEEVTPQIYLNILVYQNRRPRRFLSEPQRSLIL